MDERTDDAATQAPHEPMSADDFLAWAVTLPATESYELVDGRLHRMQAERVVHARVKAEIGFQLETQLRAAGGPCRYFPDGMAINTPDGAVFEPDGAVVCGPPERPDAVALTDATILIEVASPSTSRIDETLKLERYFLLPSLAHYLVIAIDQRRVLHFSRGAEDPTVSSLVRLHRGGTLALDPPGLRLDLDAVMAVLSEHDDASSDS